MSLHLLPLFALLSFCLVRIVQTQTTFAVCLEEYKWASGLPLPQRQPRVIHFYETIGVQL